MPAPFPIPGKTVYDPYDTYFPRGKFLKPFLAHGKTFVHPFNRAAHLAYFKSKNPDGHHHDLGAQDVFLDNLGMLVAEQFSSAEELATYMCAVHHCLRYWTFLRMQVVQREPWWGSYFNSRTRQANAGEPRSLLRFMGRNNWAEFHPSMVEDLLPEDVADGGDESSPSSPVFVDVIEESDHKLFADGNWVNPWGLFRELFPDRLRAFDDWQLFEDWDGGLLIPNAWRWDNVSTEDSDLETHSTGVELPADWSKKVDRLLVLHPDQSTPDLPLRVGSSAEDLKLYGKLVQNQRSHPTCVAHALSVGLDLLVRRQYGLSTGRVRFSPAWVHCASARGGQDWSKGRGLGNAIDALNEELPCSEEAFPYADGPSGFAAWKTPGRIDSSQTLTRRFGLPAVRKLEPSEIAQIKTLLAAGWIVVVTTSLTKEFLGRGFNRYGLPLTPLVGQTRETMGHAWLLVGYDHVDGQRQWKYQGRFIALNSWGSGWPTNPIRGAGLCHIPFAMLLSEGIEAYALRMPHT